MKFKNIVLLALLGCVVGVQCTGDAPAKPYVPSVAAHLPAFISLADVEWGLPVWANINIRCGCKLFLFVNVETPTVEERTVFYGKDRVAPGRFCTFTDVPEWVKDIFVVTGDGFRTWDLIVHCVDSGLGEGFYCLDQELRVKAFPTDVVNLVAYWQNPVFNPPVLGGE